VAAFGPEPTALCGFRYTREPHRTWEQTMIPRRCPKCQGLVEELAARDKDPVANPLWAVPTGAGTEASPGVVSAHHTTLGSRPPVEQITRHGVARAT
jgi:hypothetical protein